MRVFASSGPREYVRPALLALVFATGLATAALPGCGGGSGGGGSRSTAPSPSPSSTVTPAPDPTPTPLLPTPTPSETPPPLPAGVPLSDAAPDAFTFFRLTSGRDAVDIDRGVVATHVTAHTASDGTPIPAGPVLWNWRTGAERSLAARPGFRQTRAWCIAGDTTVGYVKDAGFVRVDARFTRWNNATGEATDLASPGAQWSIPLGANDRETLVESGEFNEIDGGVRHYLYDNATNQRRRVLSDGTGFRIIRGMDDRVVVGESDSGLGLAMRWEIATGRMTALATGTYRSGHAFGAGGGGYVVGDYAHPAVMNHSPVRAVVWDPDGRPLDLHPASGRFESTRAVATNSRSSVGNGWFPDAPLRDGLPARHALLWDNRTGACVDLHAAFGPEFVDASSEATGIDAAGNICGNLILPDETRLTWALSPR